MVHGATLLKVPFPFPQSCIIKRYCEKRFVPKYLATIGIDYGVTKYVPHCECRERGVSHAVTDGKRGSAWARCLTRGGSLVSLGAEGRGAVWLSHLLLLLSDHMALSSA